MQTISNGHRPSIKARSSKSSTDCIVVSVIQSRKMEMRALGYQYAMYKLPGEEKATRGFGFKKDCVLDIDIGFTFDEDATLIFNGDLHSTVIRDEFYPEKPEVPPIAAEQLQEDGVFADTDRIQDLPTPTREAAPLVVVPRVNMSIDQLMTYLTPEDQSDLKRQLAYTIAAAKCLGVSQAAMWQQATSLAGVHFIPAFDPRYKESLR